MNKLVNIRYEVWVNGSLFRVYKTYREASLHALLQKGIVKTITKCLSDNGMPMEKLRLEEPINNKVNDVWDLYHSR